MPPESVSFFKLTFRSERVPLYLYIATYIHLLYTHSIYYIRYFY